MSRRPLEIKIPIGLVSGNTSFIQFKTGAYELSPDELSMGSGTDAISTSTGYAFNQAEDAILGDPVQFFSQCNTKLCDITRKVTTLTNMVPNILFGPNFLLASP